MKPNWRRNYLRYKTYFLNVVANYNQRGELKVYLELVLSLLTISIFSVFALRPTLLTIGNLVKENQAKKDTISQLESKKQQLGQAQAVFNNNRSNIDLLEIALPEKAQPDVFSRQVEALAAKHQIAKTTMNISQVTLKGVATVNPKEAKSIAELPDGAKGFTFSISLEVPIGSYSYLTEFLRDFENLRTLVKTNSIAINTSSIVSENTNAEGTSGQVVKQKVKVLNMIISGEVLYYPPTN